MWVWVRERERERESEYLMWLMPEHVEKVVGVELEVSCDVAIEGVKVAYYC